MNQMMDPRLLRAFIGVVDDAGFTRAAERLHMTQSTISQQIARLEEQIGHPLIDRNARPIRMTPAGERLAGYARRILALQSEAHLALSEPSGTIPIRIGLAEDILTTEMARLFAAFAAANRHVQLDVTSGLSGALKTRYRSGEFDIVVVKETSGDADARLVLPEPIGWFEAAGTECWPTPLPFVTFPPGGLYRDQMFARASIEAHSCYIAFAASSLHNVLTAVEAGLGISLLPLYCVAGREIQTCSVFGTEPSMSVSVYAWESSGTSTPLVTEMQGVLARRSEMYERSVYPTAGVGL